MTRRVTRLCLAMLVGAGCSGDTPAGDASSSGSSDSVGADDDPLDDGEDTSDSADDGDTSADDGSGPSTEDGPGDSDDDATTATSADSSGGEIIGCDGAPWIVCEDFEGATIGGNPDGWALRASGVWGGGSMGTSDEQAVSGAQSFRLQSGSTGAQWLAYQGDISAFADGHWGRMLVRMSLPVPWPSGGVIHGDMVEARGNWNGSTHQVRWAVINNSQMKHNWGYNVQTSNAGEFIHETGYIYDWTEEWLCVEWHHDQSAQNATLWIDGEMILDVTEADDPQLPTFDDISVGWANYQAADPEFVLFLDDVALHTERIGCPGG